METQGRATLIACALVALVALGCFPEVVLGGRLFWIADFRDAYLGYFQAALQGQEGFRPTATAPLLGAGFPLGSEGQVGTFYPPHYLFLNLWDLPRGLTLETLAHFALLGVFMVLFLRRTGASAPAAALGALGFLCCGSLVGHLHHLTVLISLAWTPLALAAWLPGTRPGGGHRGGSAPPTGAKAPVGRDCHRQSRSAQTEAAPPRIGLVVCGAALALQCLAGYPPVVLLTALALGVLAAGEALASRSSRPLGRLAVAGLVAALLGAPQWLWTFVHLPESTRAEASTAFNLTYSWPPWQGITLLVPDFFGHPLDNTAWGAENYDELQAYTGVIPLLFAFLGLRGLARDRVRSGFAVLALLGLLLALGHYNPVWQVLVQTPPFSWFRAPARYLLWFQLALAVLAAHGLDAWLASLASGGRPRRFATGASIVLGAAMVATALSAWLAPAPWTDAARALVDAGLGPRPRDPAHLEAVAAQVRGEFLPWRPTVAGGLLACALVALAGLRGRALPGALAAGLLALAHLAGSVPVLRRANPTTGPAFYEPPAMIAAVQADSPAWHERLVHVDTAPYLAWVWRPGHDDGRLPHAPESPWRAAQERCAWAGPALHGVAQAHTFVAMPLARYTSLLGALQEGLVRWSRDGGEPPGAVGALARVLGVRYVVTSARLPAPLARRLRELPALGLYRLELPLAAAWSPAEVRGLGSFEELLAALAEGGVDPGRTLLVEGPGADTTPLHIEGVRPGPDELEVLTTGERPGHVVASLVHSAGWTAELDGRPWPVLRAYGALLAARVPEGRHRLRFVYRAPFAAARGGLFALGCLATLGLLSTGLPGRRHG
ncbi:MAG: hypothetical protein HY722_02495 [Planctomycetes bacterium]|nr:hypothetical protein [Planctomycetota bacterium]